MLQQSILEIPNYSHINELFKDENLVTAFALAPKLDVAFVYRDRPSKFQLQNFFRVTSNHQSWRLQMIVHEIHSDANYIHKIHISNFGKDNRKCAMKNLILWEGRTVNFGEQVLIIDKSIHQFYLSTPLVKDRDDFDISMTSNRNWWRDRAFTDSGRSKHKLHYRFILPQKCQTTKMKKKVEAREKSLGKLYHDSKKKSKKSTGNKRKSKQTNSGSRKQSKKSLEI